MSNSLDPDTEQLLEASIDQLFWDADSNYFFTVKKPGDAYLKHFPYADFDDTTIDPELFVDCLNHPNAPDGDNFYHPVSERALNHPFAVLMDYLEIVLNSHLNEHWLEDELPPELSSIDGITHLYDLLAASNRIENPNTTND